MIAGYTAVIIGLSLSLFHSVLGVSTRPGRASASIHINAPNHMNVLDVMVNNGSRGDNYFDPKNMNDFGVLKDVSNNAAEIPKFTKLVNYKGPDTSDNEVSDLMKKYFWGKTNGIIMEIGATDGVESSQSLPLESGEIGWHRILVEGNPEVAKALATNTPHAFSFTCAICDTSRQVHYAAKGNIGGIVEFMSPAFASRHHNYALELPVEKWTTIPGVQKIACFPLHKILAVTNVYHINAFVLDVEGGELAILNSINWHEIMFDVIVVETEARYRPPAYEAKVTAFLNDKGYQWLENKGRNSWYKRITFVPSAQP